eukprot:jgi/Astpho2/2353/Aster-x0103
MHCSQHPDPPPASVTGSYEVWRPDVSSLPASVLGKNLSGWAGERWWDIRSSEVRSLMQSRLDLCKSKGFDAADPDNVNAYLQDTGFNLTAQDQLDFNIFLANEAHSRSLSVGLKNELDQIPELVAAFDFEINES